MTRTCPKCGKENKSAGAEYEPPINGKAKIIPSFCWHCNERLNPEPKAAK